MDRFESMSILLHAVEAGSLSEASRRLSLPLATVSRKVSELETHLRATLLTRSSKGLVLTPAGRSFVAAAKTILEELNEAERTAAGEYSNPKGDLVVAAPVVFGRRHVLPIVFNFLNVYPQIDVSLVFNDRVAHIVDDHIDVALRIGDLPDSNFIANRVGSVRWVTCASPAYLAKHGLPKTPEDLHVHTAISYEGVFAPVTWRFDASDQQTTTMVKARVSVNDVEAALDAAIAGMGIIRALSYQVVEFIRQGKLVIILERFEPSLRPVQLVYSSQSRLPLKLRVFVDFVVPLLRARLNDAVV